MQAKVVLLGLLISGSAWAERDIPETPESSDSTLDMGPSMELLEFLGTFQDSSGRWIDPLLLDPAGDGPHAVPEQHDDQGEGPADGTQDDDQ